MPKEFTEKKSTAKPKAPQKPTPVEREETFVVVDRDYYTAAHQLSWAELLESARSNVPGLRVVTTILTVYKPRPAEGQPDPYPDWPRLAFFYKGEGRLAGLACLRQQNWTGRA